MPWVSLLPLKEVDNFGFVLKVSRDIGCVAINNNIIP